MSRKVIIGVVLLGSLPALDVLAESFEEYQRHQSQGFEARHDEYSRYSTDIDEGFARYQAELKKAFAEYRAAAAQVWGGREALVPDKRRWVEYDGQMRERSVVDFEKGKVRVELAVEGSELNDPHDLRDRLARAVERTVRRPPDERSIIDIAHSPQRPDEPRAGAEPMLVGQVATPGGGSLGEDQIEAFARQVAEQAATRRVSGEDGQQRLVISGEFELVPDHIRVRAERFVPEVRSQSQRMQVSPELVLAVIETESFFNPTARSPVPAFGLMQLVPTAGARDAYRHVYKKDRILSDRYLYDPRNNIELGAAYLNKIYFDYLDGIKDPQSRWWCTVAAYNTGAGNIFRTFGGSTRSKSAALARINGMSSERVFEYLRAHLPYQETRKYIVKVRERMPKYRGILGRAG